jgi:hypothetical protein
MAESDAGGIAAAVDEAAWRDFVEHVAEAVDIGPGTGVYDVACGAGAFLYPFYENAYRVGGLDAAAGNLAQAGAAMPEGRFSLGGPSALDPAEPWDVVACAGFARFPDLDYARGVMARMCAKATHAVAILNVPDADLESGRRDRLFFDRRWMLRALAEIGATAIRIEEVTVPGYEGVGTPFNVFARL